ncbi:Cytochrome P450 monooxygenase COX2 [Psilocybe cubensis]|uniref:Cytochrome P450 monooxygenase COX2 n=2 Tax=Psilocybe cubensis TaxID=181762 RepID=A0ACB8GRL3_PSICU|nr:Cytochrome P450 monooxygenase COX2 [Psilocybe cubensis]KAH9478383.1 Cytochrome P450 monooxygenase COX2 [Psilocybe cubensis]
MPQSTTLVYAFVGVFGVKILLDYVNRIVHRAPYPPGPPPKPLVGNIFDLPVKVPAERYIEWSKKYDSPVVYAEALGSRLIVINKREDAIELCERRAKIYSDRPHIPMVNLMAWNHNIAFLGYGDEWRRHRKLCQQSFNFVASQQYHSIQMNGVEQFLRSLCDTPEDFDAHSRMLSVSITMEMMYGIKIKSIDEPCITIADEAIKLGTDLLVPSGSLVNILPILRHVPAWFPGATSLKRAERVRRMTEIVMKIPVDQVKAAFEEGKASASFYTNFIEKKQTLGASEEEEEMVRNIAYTTVSSTGSFLYFMAVNPDVQKKAQEEIDRLTGSKRLPTLEDRQSLPFVEAIYREVMRMRPPLPLGVPHRVVEDDYYKGYLIPKGATIFTNIWAMCYEEEDYPDPYTFKPERFFDKNGKLNDDDRVLAFGFGRRVCVGKYIASSTLWLMMASVLACFNVVKAKDDNGNEIEINHEIEDLGLLNQKAKFKCSFQVRSPAIKKLIVDGQ